MQTIEWDFSNPDWLASIAYSIGLTSMSGVPFALTQQASYSDQVVNGLSGDMRWHTTLVEPSLSTVGGALLVGFMVSAPNNLTNPQLVNVGIQYGGTTDFDGTDVTPLYAARIDTIEHHVFVVFGLLALDDLSSFATSRLVLDLDNCSLAGTINVAAQVAYFNGVDQASIADGLSSFTFEVGAADTFATPLSLDPGPSNEFDVVLTQAYAARLSSSDAGTIEITTDGYLAAEETPSINAGLMTFAYTMACDTSYNCECETDPEAKTLAELRVETLKLTGYAMQASNPPPGVAEQYNALLRTAQSYLVTRYKPLETERFFSWTLTPGIRYYGLRDNRNCCDVKLNKYRITGAWLQDLNNVWWPLIYGIDPTFYTLNVNFGWPAFYEVRQCIEIFPAPQAAYTLWVKGHYNLLPFEEDDDVTTINAEIVKNWAVFLAKSAKGMADAPIWSKMTGDQVGQLIAGSHVSKRYIPGTSEIPVPTPPVMVHFDA